MKKLTNGTASVTLMVLLGLFVVAEAQSRVLLATGGPRYHQSPSNHELIFEGGLAEPMGDQSDGFWTTDNGFGSSTGYQTGVRFRQYLGEFFAVSPAFHYTRFGTATGVTDVGPETDLAYNIRTSNYRYGFDLQAFMGGGGSPMRLFMTGGVALVNNRYRDQLQYHSTFEEAVNTPAYSAGLGLKMRNIELVGEYTYNRFDTNKFTNGETPLSYNWDSFIVRIGVTFGR